jgi:hypothetical protein
MTNDYIEAGAKADPLHCLHCCATSQSAAEAARTSAFFCIFAYRLQAIACRFVSLVVHFQLSQEIWPAFCLTASLSPETTVSLYERSVF